MDTITAASARSSLGLEDRRKLTLSGVTAMGAATPTQVTAETGLGGLVVKGAELHIVKYSQEDGLLVLCGHFDSMAYETSATKQSMWKRMWK